MKLFLLLIVFVNVGILFSQNTINTLSVLTNTTGIPTPPSIKELPNLEIISSIITDPNAIEDIKDQFGEEAPYTGNVALLPPESAEGVWWRFYTQTTSMFNILAVSEEILSIGKNGLAYWLQNVKTVDTVDSNSHRKLQIAYYQMFGHDFFVFYYSGQDPESQDVRDAQGFFVRILSDRGYMQMSKSPNFEPENSMYWKQFPQYNKQSITGEDF